MALAKNKTKIRSSAALAVSAAAMGFSPGAAGIDYAFSAGYRGEYTSNAARSAANERSDWIHRPYVTGQASHEGDRTNLNLDYRLTRRSYRDDTFDDDTIGEGSADLTVDVIRDRLSVFAANRRRETEILTLEQRVPGNLQESDVTSTGAALHLDSLSNHYLDLSYRYSIADTSETTTDSERQSATAAYVMPFSSRNVVELVATGSDVDFDDPLASDYQSTTGLLQYSRQTSRFSAVLRGGYSSIDRDGDEDEIESGVGSASFVWSVSSSSNLGLHFERELRDNQLIVENEINDLDETGTGNTDVNDIYDYRSVALRSDTELAGNTISAEIRGSSQDYEVVGRDQDILGASFSLFRQVNSRLASELDFRYRRFDFLEINQEHDEFNVGVRLIWSPTPRLNVSTGLHYFTRIADTRFGENTSEEWSGSLGVDYVLFSNRRGR